MKKLLSALTIVSVSFFAACYLKLMHLQPNVTVGIGYNEAVYAAEGREDKLQKTRTQLLRLTQSMGRLILDMDQYQSLK